MINFIIVNSEIMYIIITRGMMLHLSVYKHYLLVETMFLIQGLAMSFYLLQEINMYLKLTSSLKSVQSSDINIKNHKIKDPEKIILENKTI